MTTTENDSQLRGCLDHFQFNVWQTAENSGWHSIPASLAERIALIHSEASEALEEVRLGNDPRVIYYRDADGDATSDPTDQAGNLHKTEGVAAEFADIIIRILDAAEQEGIPVVSALLHKAEYNKTRPYRHGGKKL